MPEFPPPANGPAGYANGPASYQPPPYDPASLPGPTTGSPGSPGAGNAQPWAAPDAEYGWPAPAALNPYGFVHPAKTGPRLGWLIAAGVTVAVVVALAAFLVVGGGSHGSGPAAPPPASAAATAPGALAGQAAASTATTAPATGSSGTESPAALGAVLESFAIQQSDFTNGWTVRLIPGGDRVRGQVTLDNCGYRFTTEAHRVARRQYDVVDGRGRDTGLSNEVVAYDSPASAAEALAQWHTAAAHCPSGLIRSATAGTPRMYERVLRDERDDVGLPVGTNAVTVERFSLPSGQVSYGIAMLQVRDRFLDAVYVVQGRLPTTQDLAATALIASATGDRLLSAG